MKRHILAVCISALCLSASILVAAHGAEPVRVAVLPFQIHSPEDLSYLQRGLMDMLASRLAQGGGIQVVERASVLALKEDLASSGDVSKATALGKKLGADFVVFGSISKLGGHVSLDGQVADVRKGSTSAQLSAEAPSLDGVIPQVGRLAQEIRAVALGQPVAKAPVAQAAPQVAVAQSSGGGLPQQQIVPGTAAMAYPVPPGRYPVPPGGFTGRGDDVFTRSEDQPAIAGPEGSLNPAFIMAYQADKARRGYSKSPDLGLADIQAVDIGDVDGDGAPEGILADEDRIYIYKNIMADASNRTVVNLVAPRAKVVGLDVADVNKNGVAEIYVTAILEKGETVVSQVVEYRDGRYQVLAHGLPYFFRVTRSIRDGMVLLAQEKRTRFFTTRVTDTLFSPFNKIFRMKWEGEKLVKGEEIPLKEEVCVLGLTMVDMDRDGVDEYLAFDQRDYLKLFNARGGLVWVSTEPYGRTGNYFLKDLDRGVPPNEDPPDSRVWLPARIVTVDLDQDGIDEVILCHNYEPLKFFPQSRFFTKSAIFSLSWDGVDFMENWRTREMKGYVSDYQVKATSKDGKPELLVALVYKRGTMDYLKTSVTLLAFELNVEKAKAPKDKAKKETEKVKPSETEKKPL